jgi:type IV secretory pathway component VirB8
MEREEKKINKKPTEKEFKDNTGLFLKTVGYESFIIRALMLMVALLFLVILVQTAAIVLQSKRLTDIKPLVVYVDRDTGITEVREFDVVDARNEKRNENETWIFVNEYLKNLYDYTHFSQLRNLENAYVLCNKSVKQKVKEYFIRDGRPGRVKSEVLGMCEVESVFIMDTLPDLRVRVVFEKKVIRPGGSLIMNKKIEAILRVKTVVRDRNNNHGLYITDYRETIIDEKKGEMQ